MCKHISHEAYANILSKVSVLLNWITSLEYVASCTCLYIPGRNCFPEMTVTDNVIHRFLSKIFHIKFLWIVQVDLSIILQFYIRIVNKTSLLNNVSWNSQDNLKMSTAADTNSPNTTLYLPSLRRYIFEKLII